MLEMRPIAPILRPLETTDWLGSDVGGAVVVMAAILRRRCTERGAGFSWYYHFYHAFYGYAQVFPWPFARLRCGFSFGGRLAYRVDSLRVVCALTELRALLEGQPVRILCVGAGGVGSAAAAIASRRDF